MSKDKKEKSAKAATKGIPPDTSEVVVDKKNKPAFDPALASLFASSSGPISAPVRPIRSSISKKNAIGEEQQQNPKQLNESEGFEDDDGDSDVTSASESLSSDEDIDVSQSQSRKRRKLDKEDTDLEATYFDRLARKDANETDRLRKTSAKLGMGHDREDDNDDDDSATSASNDLEDLSDVEQKDSVPQHESLTKTDTNSDHDKTRRTVFLGNVSTDAIKLKSARKQLETHLKSVLDTDLNETIESIRFRSTAYDITAGPKKAAYAKKELMDDTSKTTNAYVVFNTDVAARKVAKKLNGTVVLDRHLHTDWLAHPTAIDHKRCVFVGNLNFVDLESNVDNNNEDKEEGKRRRPKARAPADADEGLWQTFGKCGTIESVRVVRDPVTRVGKGFAYVQFTDEIATEKALALDGKKFPPMLPRTLRVSRAKRVLKKDLKRKRDNNNNSNNKSGGVDGSAINKKPSKQKDTMLLLRNKKTRSNDASSVVFEGYRATAVNKMKFKSKSKSRSSDTAKSKKATTKTKTKSNNRSSRRGAAFKAGGGRKKRDLT